VACLQDGGAVRYSFGTEHDKYKKIALHPIQFAEATARIFYDLVRFNRVPKFILIEGNGIVQVVMNPLGGLSGKPLFREGDMEEYAQVLAHCSRLPLEVVHPVPGKVMSWLFDSGKLKQMLPDD
jgi:hypothetical protein